MIESRESPYLEQEVFGASPAKLRWLLINKSLQLTRIIDQLWQDKDPGAGQYTVWLRDVLNELLAAVHGQDDLAKKVADLYVFMTKLLSKAEQTQNVDEIRQLRSLLEIEAETWQMVCLAQSPQAQSLPGQSLPSQSSQSQQTGASNLPPLSDLSLSSGEGFCLDV